MKSTDYLILGGVALAGYFLWRSTSAIKKGVDSAVTAIAKGYVSLTSGETVPLGSIQLPNGQYVPVSSVTVKPGPGTSAVFSYNGVNYSIDGGSDANGNWTARAVGASGNISSSVPAAGDPFGVTDSSGW